MKYRIVELNSGKYQIQFKFGLLDNWRSMEHFFITHEDAKEGIKQLKSNEIKRIVEVIE